VSPFELLYVDIASWIEGKHVRVDPALGKIGIRG